MKATVRNMRELLAASGEPIAVPGVSSYCPDCDEAYSASPGDYFQMSDDEAMICCGCGGRLILVRREVRMVPL